VLDGRAAEELVDHPTLDPTELDGYDPESGEPRLVTGDGGSLRVMTADRPGLFSRISGALALHGLDIRQARAGTVEGVAVEDLEVESSFGVEIPWEAVCADLRLAISGGLAITARLSHRAAAYPSKEVPHSLQPAVRVLDGNGPQRSVVEVVGPDSIGLLYRLTCTLAELDLDISKAMVTTLGTDVVDVFYVESRSGLDLSTERARSEIRLALLHALAA
jgi:[protein-PII] uridylyltransferase